MAINFDFLVGDGPSPLPANFMEQYRRDAGYQMVDGKITPLSPSQSPIAKQTESDVQRQRDAARESASAKTILNEYGLDELGPIVDSWIRGGMSIDEAMLQLRSDSTDAGKIFDKRFPAIKLRRAAGLNPVSPAEYVAYERQARQVMRAAGLPQGFWDGREDFTNLLVGDVSVAELGDRISRGFAEVANAPAPVRAAFGEFFGANGDAALASYFLDAEKALPVLQEEVRVAQVGGASKAFGFNLGKDRARQIAQTGATFDSARTAFDNIRTSDSLFTESISEQQDLTMEQQGIDAAFALDQGEARKALSRRLEERVAKGAGTGGAAATQTGAFGLGSARK